MLAAGSSGQTLVLHLQGLGFVCSLWHHGDSRLRPMSLRRLRLMSLQASRGRCTGPGPLRGRQDRAAAVRPEPLVQRRRHENGAGAAPLFGSALLWLPCYGSRPQPVGPCPGSRRHSAAPNGSRCASEPVCQTRTGVRANAAVVAGDICGTVVAATDGDPARPSESPLLAERSSGAVLHARCGGHAAQLFCRCSAAVLQCCTAESRTRAEVRTQSARLSHEQPRPLANVGPGPS